MSEARETFQTALRILATGHPFDEGETMIAQMQVDEAIDHLIAEAAKFEFARDVSRYESAEYWRHHDSAINLILMAEQLMPQKSMNPFRD